MPQRLRLVAVQLKPHFVVDDGDTLTPAAVEPINVNAKDWPNVVARLAELQAKAEAQLGSGLALPAAT